MLSSAPSRPETSLEPATSARLVAGVKVDIQCGPVQRTACRRQQCITCRALMSVVLLTHISARSKERVLRVLCMWLAQRQMGYPENQNGATTMDDDLHGHIGRPHPGEPGPAASPGIAEAEACRQGCVKKKMTKRAKRSMVGARHGRCCIAEPRRLGLVSKDGRKDKFADHGSAWRNPQGSRGIVNC